MLVEDLLDAWNVEVLLEMTLVYRLFIESLISSTRRAFSGRRVQLSQGESHWARALLPLS